jgi:dimethylhistidine N-methyltransferase
MTTATQYASHDDAPIPSSSVATEVLAGLRARPKRIAPKYFYDQKGSALFDAITRVDEYYLRRVERQIFRDNVGAICDAIGTGATVIEPGAGSCEKIAWLLPELAPDLYVPMDISGEHLMRSAAALGERFSQVATVPQVCDHTVGLELAVEIPEGQRVFFYPGSSIGNFEPAAAVEFMRRMRALMQRDGGLLIGVDTKKDRDVLHAAYNDAEGVTAAFNLNVLDHLNAQLDGNFCTDNFEHHALYNEAAGRIEMHLRCKRDHAVELAGELVEFDAGELVHTESSYKYHPEEFAALGQRAGLKQRACWQDERRWFAVLYLTPT